MASKPTYSMTGFGVGRNTTAGGTVVVEMKSVNHRFLEPRVRLSSRDLALESELEGELRARFKRGRIDVFVSWEAAPDGCRTVEVDLPLAKGYLAALRELTAELKLEETATLPLLARMSGVLKDQSSAANEEFRLGTMRAFALACANLEATRQREGEATAQEITKLMQEVERNVAAIRERVPEVCGGFRRRLEERLTEVLQDTQFDRTRLEQEVAFLCERADIGEELDRLTAHLCSFREKLGHGSPVGRELDFLLQEMFREVNTLGSKANDSAVASRAVEAKVQLERIREQVQNLE
jgi:uncharacterized protein (TIGR00255 family)